MEALEREILLQLIEDSGQPVSKIAKKVGASRQTVAKKIEELRKSGVVGPPTARLIPAKLGLGTRAYIFLREDPSSEVRRGNEGLIGKLPQVFSFHRLFGRYSAVLEVWTRDSKELTDLVKKIHSLKGVRETETFIVHSTVKDRPEEPLVHVLRSAR